MIGVLLILAIHLYASANDVLVMLQSLLTTQNIVIALVILSWMLVLQVIPRKYPNSERIRAGRLTATLETKRGKELFEYLASTYNRILQPLGSLGVIMTFSIMAIASVFFFIASISSIMSPESVQSISASNYFLIPGLNDFLPLSVATEIIIGVFIAMILHEGAHAVYCRMGDITVETSGLVFFSYLPAGAFVRPDEEEVENAEYLPQLRMLSAGILTNMASSIVFILLFVVITSQLVVPAAGVPVNGSIEGSSASDQGLGAAQIVSINNTSVSSQEDIQNVITGTDTVTLTTSDGETISFTKELSVQQTIPQITDLPTGSQISEVNGEEVTTIQELEEVSQQSSGEELQLTTDSGETYSVPVGAAITLSDGSYIIAQSINGITITNGQEFTSNFSGDSVQVTTTTGDQMSLNREEISQVYQGISGVSVTDTGIIYTNTSLYEAFFFPFENNTSIVQWISLFVILPVLSLIGGTEVFYGFADEVTRYYTISGGDPMFFIATILYWTAWISVNVGVFNALPIPALDGGQMVESSISEIADKYSLTEATERWVLYSIYLFAGLSVLTMVILPILV